LRQVFINNLRVYFVVFHLKVNIMPTKKVTILGLDRRDLADLGFCAVTFGANRLFWVNGLLLCLEVYEKSFEYEIERGNFYVSQLCYTELPKYSRILEVEKGTQIPIANVSDMQIYKEIAKAIMEFECRSRMKNAKLGSKEEDET
jgi:hypothetical protein